MSDESWTDQQQWMAHAQRNLNRPSPLYAMLGGLGQQIEQWGSEKSHWIGGFTPEDARVLKTRDAIAWLRSRGKYCLDVKVQKGAVRPPREVPFWRRVATHLDAVEGKR